MKNSFKKGDLVLPHPDIKSGFFILPWNTQTKAMLSTLKRYSDQIITNKIFSEYKKTYITNDSIPLMFLTHETHIFNCKNKMHKLHYNIVFFLYKHGYYFTIFEGRNCERYLIKVL